MSGITAKYARDHRRVVRVFGKASEWQCQLCFDYAAEWAHLWRTHPDKADPYSYVPMCKQDHEDYDNNSAQARATRRWTDLGQRERQSEITRQLWQDPEYRAMMCAKAAGQMRKQWSDLEFRAERIEAAKRAGRQRGGINR